jgi:DNA polymerase-3 subunit delta'
MSWSTVIGQERIKTLLKRILQTKKVAHAFLFYGPEGIGKDALAIEFAKALNCSEDNIEACGMCTHCLRMQSFAHPNVRFVFALPVGKNEKAGDDPINVLSESQVTEVRDQLLLKSKDSYHQIEIAKANFIKINSVRDIKREAAMSQNEQGKKIFIFFNADMMNTEASNSLLKTLEEPLPNTILLLTTSKKDHLLPTIVSRCQLLQCDILTDEEIVNALIRRDAIDKVQARLIAQLSQGSYTQARRLCSLNIIEERREIVEFLRIVLGKNKTVLIDAIDELSSTSEKRQIQRWLQLLQSWIRDAMLLQQVDQSPFLEDERKSMANFISKFPDAKLFNAIQTVEKAIAHIDKNVYLHLILTTMAITLRRNIMEPSPV